MANDTHTISSFFGNSSSEETNVVDINSINKKSKFTPSHKPGEATAPDGNIREEICILMLKQQFIRHGYDLHVEDTRHLLGSYDARVYHTKYNFPWKVQIKTCYSSKYNNDCRFDVRNVSLYDLQNKYKNVPIFVFYLCYDQITIYGIENRSRLYIVKNIDLQQKIKEWGYRNSNKLPFNTDDHFWITHCAKFDIFEEHIKQLNDKLLRFKFNEEIGEVCYTVGELSDAELICEELDIKFDIEEFLRFMQKNLKFDKRAFRKYIKIHKKNIEHG